MKLNFINSICFLLISISTFASPTFYKTWIGEKLEYLELTKRKARFDSGQGLRDFGLSISDSTLKLIDHFYASGKLGRQHENYLYKIIHLTEDSLIVSPLNERAARLIDDKKVFVFIDKARLYKKDLKFQGLYFSGTPCFGDCPGMKLQIDSSGLTHFFGEFNTGIYKGLYKVQLRKTQLDSLTELLKLSELDRFPVGLGGAMDAPTYEFKFHYNNKIKTSEGYFVPYLDRPLLNFLLRLYCHTDLKKSEEPFEFEK